MNRPSVFIAPKKIVLEHKACIFSVAIWGGTKFILAHPSWKWETYRKSLVKHWAEKCFFLRGTEMFLINSVRESCTSCTWWWAWIQRSFPITALAYYTGNVGFFEEMGFFLMKMSCVKSVYFAASSNVVQYNSKIYLLHAIHLGVTTNNTTMNGQNHISKYLKFLKLSLWLL